jgi:AMP deaminase
MNQKHLLRFIKHKLRHVPNEIVTFRDGKYLTLGEVFESLKLTGNALYSLLYSALFNSISLYSATFYCAQLYSTLPDSTSLYSLLIMTKSDMTNLSTTMCNHAHILIYTHTHATTHK